MNSTLDPLVKNDHIAFLQDTVPQAVKKLAFETTPAWGEMTAQHMVEHLASTVALSTILSQNERQAPNKSQQEAQNFLLYSAAEFPRNIMNPLFKNGLPPYTHPTIEEAKSRMLKNLELFFRTFSTSPQGYSFNSVLGDLDYDQLLILHHKHIKHHFTQFGVL